MDSVGHTIIKGINRLRPVKDMTVEERRREFERFAKLLPKARGARFEAAADLPVPGEWVTTPGRGSGITVLHLHGGAYVVGSPRTHRPIASRISKVIGGPVLMPEYRLAPEHPFPAALEDALAVVEALYERGTDPRHLVFTGDSAGGGLALSLLVRMRDLGMDLPAAAVVLSPWTDLALTGDSMTDPSINDPWLTKQGARLAVEAYVGDLDPTHPLISPLYAELHGLPPILIQVGTGEILLDDARRFAERARAVGVDVTLDVWRDQIHVFQAFAPFVPAASRALHQIGVFVRSSVGVELAG